MKAKDWIRVQDILPEKNTRVLVVIKCQTGSMIGTGKLLSDGWAVSDYGYAKVTHWMQIVMPEED